ncbi:unnamed protein product [Callosobruchus maculatus]|uniref:Nicastrin n=1 Tax=Callosobruchus maculatus TaxID=64391 RepID=A0A653BV97_CALMS|nr:unnamed protein product [Callosobruchus maculatus]
MGDNITCNICDKQYSNVSNLNKHVRLLHNIEPQVKKRCLVCPTCMGMFATYVDLRDHLITTHKVEMYKEEKCFNNYAEMKCAYVKTTGNKSWKNTEKVYYICHRSHVQRSYRYAPQEEQHKMEKSQGSAKASVTCPSTLDVTLGKQQLNAVLYFPHVGHTCSLAHINLTKTERKHIAGKISEGVSFEKILDEIRDSITDKTSLGRINLLDRQDLRNITRDFSLKGNIQLHQNDVKGVFIILSVKILQKNNIFQIPIMNKTIKCTLSACIILQILSRGHGERTKDKMYERITGARGCYRRLNATHQIADRDGSTGVIYYAENIEQLDFILHNGTAPPYIPVIPVKNLSIDVIKKLIDSGLVSGLMVHANNDSLDYFTHDYQCPNPLSSIDGTCRKDSMWNPHGTALLFADIPFPIFYLEEEEEVWKIRDCFKKFNDFHYEAQSDRPLCSLELKSFMYATIDTPTCKRRSSIMTNLNPVKFCDPLGDSNIWASLYPLVEGSRNETVPLRNYKYIVVSARMDTTSMFEKTVGGNSPVTGIVTLLTVAKYLKGILKQEDIHEAKLNVLFILFNGETYDYIGSQRLLYDMLKGDFPVKGLDETNSILPIIRPDDIELFIELSQLGNNRDELYMHYLQNRTEILNFYSKLHNYSEKMRDVPHSLPPASLHTFMKMLPSFPGLVISDHETSYTNHFYNSIFDDMHNIGFEYYPNATEQDIREDSLQYFIANVSEIVGKSVYETITGKKYSGKQTADVVLVNELFQCYLEDPNCKVHKATQKGKLPKVPVSLYVGVDHVANYATTLTSLTLGWLTADDVGESDINCSNHPRNYAFKYYNMSKSIQELNTTRCYKITMNTTDAISPAFIIPVVVAVLVQRGSRDKQVCHSVFSCAS